MRLKNKLLSWVFSLFFIPLLIFFALAVSGTYNRYKSNYSLIKEDSIIRLQENYYEKINSIENDAEGFIGSIKAGDSPETINEKINFMKNLNNEYEHIFYIDSYNNTELTDNTDSVELKKLISEIKNETFEFFISNPYIDKVSNKSTVTFIKKIKNNNLDQKIIGITVFNNLT